MITKLELMASKEFISRTIRVIGRGAWHAGAYGLAFPIGTFLWIHDNTAENIGFMEEPLTNEKPIADITSASPRYTKQKPTWWSHVSGLYDTFKPYS